MHEEDNQRLEARAIEEVGSIGRSTGQWSETLTPIYTDDTDQGQWIDFCFEIGVIGVNRC
jgi:hypothetical protein